LDDIVLAFLLVLSSSLQRRASDAFSEKKEKNKTGCNFESNTSEIAE
jgi:hypothetical protein